MEMYRYVALVSSPARKHDDNVDPVFNPVQYFIYKVKKTHKSTASYDRIDNSAIQSLASRLGVVPCVASSCRGGGDAVVLHGL